MALDLGSGTKNWAKHREDFVLRFWNVCLRVSPALFYLAASTGMDII